MKLLLAQGNPGANYARTRHNAGWIIIDTLAETFGATWKSSGKFNALLAEVNLHGQKVILAKPLTFYNETGQVARSLADFYSLDPSNDLLVLHDELALPFGAVRVRQKGSDAGNNGIKSLNVYKNSKFDNGLSSSNLELSVGQRVFHQKFGMGLIISSDGDKLNINFDKAGEKKVVSSFVKIIE